MLICNNCGNAINDPSKRFCAECGASVTVHPNNVPTLALPSPPTQPPPQADFGFAPTIHPTATPQHVQNERKPNHLPWILISAGVLIIIGVVVVGFNISGAKNVSVNTPSNSNTGTSNNNIRDPSKVYPNGHWAVCKFTPVHVRKLPALDAQIITDIASGDRVWVIKESSNYDTFHINSLDKDVYDNWSEVELENTAVHGWIFSAFIR